MLAAYRDRERAQRWQRNALAFAQENSWGVKKHDYLAVVSESSSMRAP